MVVAFKSAATVPNQAVGFAADAFASAYICTNAGLNSLGTCLRVFELCERANAGVRSAFCPPSTGFRNGHCDPTCTAL